MATTAGTAASGIEAHYDDVLHALKVAYRHESRAIIKINPYLRDLRGSTVRASSGDDTPWDRFIGAALIRAAIASKLPPEQQAVLEAHYTVPHTPDLQDRKLRDCLRLAKSIAETQKIPLPYVYDVTREWAGHGRLHADGWWRLHLNVSSRSLRSWRHGRRWASGQKDGILPTLYAMLDIATDALETALYVQGAIKFLRREK